MHLFVLYGNLILITGLSISKKKIGLNG